MERLVGFSFIWAALILFWVEGMLQHRKLKLAAETPNKAMAVSIRRPTRGGA